MKTSITILFCLTFMNLSSCKTTDQNKMTIEEQINQQEIETITNEHAYFQKWIAGIQGGGSGINVYIPKSAYLHFTNEDGSRTAKYIYFRGQKVAVTYDLVEGKIYLLGRFPTQLNQKKDVKMNGNAEGEYGNESPIQMKNQDFPFELKNNEAVVEYIKNGEKQWVKIIEIKEKPMLAMPMKKRPEGQN